MFCATRMQYFMQNVFRACVNSIQYDHLITVETIT